MNRQSLYVLGVVLSLVFAPEFLGYAPLRNSEQKPIVVDVQRVVDNMPPERAKVLIIGEDGRDLAVGYTNQFGRAELKYVDASERPRYVLVDTDGYFVTGLRWHSGQLEYYILLGPMVMR